MWLGSWGGENIGNNNNNNVCDALHDVGFGGIERYCKEGLE